MSQANDLNVHLKLTRKRSNEPKAKRKKEKIKMTTEVKQMPERRQIKRAEDTNGNGGSLRQEGQVPWLSSHS